MTLTALVVLAAGLASGAGRSPSAAPDARDSSGPGPGRPRPQVTCTLRVVHAPAGLDGGILMRQPKRIDGVPANAVDGMVQDTVSPCERP